MRRHHYYVEGESEKAIVCTLQKMGLIKTGKVEVLNALQQPISEVRLRRLLHNTIVVLIFDTDVCRQPEWRMKLGTFKNNLLSLSKSSRVHAVYCVPQVNNLEDELSRSCNLKLKDWFMSDRQTTTDFKRKLNHCSNLEQTLKDAGLDLVKMWSQKMPLPFEEVASICNDSKEIKITK